MTLERYHGGEWILLSYDASGRSRSAAAEVCRIIFGRTRSDGDGHARSEPGFIHRPGVVWVGQSVLLLPPRDADELAARVRRLGVHVAMGPIDATRETVERFRRPSRPRSNMLDRKVPGPRGRGRTCSTARASAAVDGLRPSPLVRLQERARRPGPPVPERPHGTQARATTTRPARRSGSTAPRRM